jgi:SAM-dependent methyltransferase
MEPERDDPGRTEELVARLRQQVEERRRAGFYPEGLEDDLDGHFRRIVSQRPGDIDAARASIARLHASMGFSPARIPIASNVAGGAIAHRAVAKVVGRQTQGVLEQMREFAMAVTDALDAVLGLLEAPGSHVQRGLVEQLDAVLERMAQLERSAVDGAGRVDIELRERVARLEQLEARRQFTPWYGNDRFEETFRGTRDELREHYRDLALWFQGSDPVVDIGCGRGEFLELLGEAGVKATGIEIDPKLVAAARARQLDVEQDDAISRLASETDTALGGVSLLQVVEHLSPQEVVDLVVLSADKLRPGGKMLIETVNPQSLFVFAHSLYIDPTHARPVHPAYLEFLFREAGFALVETQWRSPTPAEHVLEEVPGEEDTAHGRNVRRLNNLLYGPQDYAVLAVR